MAGGLRLAGESLGNSPRWKAPMLLIVGVLRPSKAESTCPPDLSPRAVGLCLLALALVTAGVLSFLGRVPWCRCGQPSPWVGDIWSSHNSQHLLDPYSFSHFQHGLAFYLLFWLLARGVVGVRGRGVLAVLLEAGWEVLENSPLVIERYRTGTISVGYVGDSIANSFGDLLSCGSGYLVAAALPALASAALFLAIEVTMVVLLRDSLLINVWMLLSPNEAMRAWQRAGLPPGS